VKSCRPDVASLVLETAPSGRVRRGACILALAGGVLTAACASGSGNWFSLGPRPPEIAGVWIDVALTSSSDTVAWILAPNGVDRTVHTSVSRDSRGVMSVAVHETSNGFWYLSGRLEDTINRAICYKRRARDGATCLRFRMDTVANTRFLRRLTVLGYKGEPLKEERVFVEMRRINGNLP
jgi:hypothetical protein